MIEQDVFIEYSKNNNDINKDEVKIIEEKLINDDEVTEDEINKLLDYIIISTNSLVNEENDYELKSLSVIKSYLDNIGLTSHVNMTHRSISNYIVEHSFIVVDIPLDGGIKEYLIDPNYKKFLNKEKCHKDKELVISGFRILSPDPGYYIDENNYELIKTFISNGYMQLNQYNAKVYGDSFYKTKTNIPSAFKLPEMSGDLYIKSFRKGNINLPDFDIGEIEILTQDIINKKDRI